MSVGLVRSKGKGKRLTRGQLADNWGQISTNLSFLISEEIVQLVALDLLQDGDALSQQHLMQLVEMFHAEASGSNVTSELCLAASQEVCIDWEGRFAIVTPFQEGRHTFNDGFFDFRNVNCAAVELFSRNCEIERTHREPEHLGPDWPGRPRSAYACETCPWEE